MKKKIKLTKSHLICFILGALIFGLVGVSAATYFPSSQTIYDNKESGLKSTDVQGAIDELYNTCFPPKAGDTILDNVDIVTSGDGLYKDEYEDRYFYRGANPNNYVTFNNEKAGWRIVSINSDGTIKIMRDASIGNRAWDSSQNNNWARPSFLNTYLNETYLASNLNSTAQSQIVSKDWSIGAVTYGNNNLADQINEEKATTWNGKVALVTVSEYIRSNSNKSSCGSFSLNRDNYSGCKNTTWMYYSSDHWWTLSPYAGNSDRVFNVESYGDIDYYHVYSGHAVRPAVYLSSGVQIVSGDGSQNNPYQIM